jgi:glycerate kinase
VRVLIAFDKFKDALAARQACESAARVLREVRSDWQLDLCPLADGGEGFADILTRAAQGRLSENAAAGPRGSPVKAPIGLVTLDKIPAAARDLLDLGPAGGPDPSQARIAVIDMASVSGLALLAPPDRNPWQTTSLGTGQLMRVAAESGVAAILLGVGGSATHDLGLGSLSAMGFEFWADDGRKIEPPLPASWARLARVSGNLTSAMPPLRIACDVANPLLGPRGAAAVFGPQKGLAAADLGRLEAESARVAALLCDYCGQPRDMAAIPGAGAAGGIAFGLMAAARARLIPGSSLVSAWLDLESRLAAADLVLTGEGRFDASSWEGKGPGALASRARALGKVVHIFAGQVEGEQTPSESRVRFHQITPHGVPLPQALREAEANLGAAVRHALHS